MKTTTNTIYWFENSVTLMTKRVHIGIKRLLLLLVHVAPETQVDNDVTRRKHHTGTPNSWLVLGRLNLPLTAKK